MNWNIRKIQIQLLTKQLSNNSCISFPLFFSIFLMILKKILVWFENRKLFHCAESIWITSSQRHMTLKWHTARGYRNHSWVIFYTDRHHWIKSDKCPFLKFDQSCSISGSSFWINYQWPLKSLLTLFLSFRNQSYSIFLLIFICSLNEYTANSFSNCTDSWQSSNTSFGYICRRLSRHCDRSVSPRGMIADNWARVFIGGFPIRAQILFVTNLWSLSWDPNNWWAPA